jgi:hypothetical protein
MNRDALKSAEWLDQWVEFSRTSLNERAAILGTPAVNTAYEPQFLKDAGFAHIKLMLRRYSRGDPISELAQYFEPLLHYWEESERLGKEVWTPEQQRIRHTWSVNLDFYIDCFWLVGLAFALEVPEAQWRRLIALVGNDGEDALLDRIIATRTPDRKIGGSLCYSKPYAQLLKAVDAPPSQQPTLLAKFVEHWYKDVGSAAKSGREKQAVPYKEPYWHNYHRMEGGYFGYWCLEAVAAVKAFGLDDSQCLGHPHYPGDLLRPGIVTPPDVSRLLPELAATIGAEPQPPFTGEPRTITSWEAFKLVLKNKFGR